MSLEINTKFVEWCNHIMDLNNDRTYPNTSQNSTLTNMINLYSGNATPITETHLMSVKAIKVEITNNPTGTDPGNNNNHTPK